MKKARRRMKLALSIAFVAIMLAGSLQVVFADSKGRQTTLPDSLVRYAEYISKGNVTEFAIIINQMVTQEQIKQDTIASTNGAILKFKPHNSQKSSETESILTEDPYYIDSISGYSEPDINPYTSTTIGEIEDPNYLIGEPDDYYAHLWTNGWYDTHGGEAIAFGPTTDSTEGGGVYVYAYTDNPSAEPNRVIVYYSGNGQDWSILGWESVSNTSPQWLYIGYALTQISHLAVCCWTAPNYSPLEENYVWIDSVMAVYGSPK